MNKRHMHSILKKVAKHYGVSVETVKKDIEALINDAKNNTDPSARAFFKEIFGEDIPTPEEFIYTLSLIVQDKK